MKTVYHCGPSVDTGHKELLKVQYVWFSST